MVLTFFRSDTIIGRNGRFLWHNDFVMCHCKVDLSGISSGTFCSCLRLGISVLPCGVGYYQFEKQAIKAKES